MVTDVTLGGAREENRASLGALKPTSPFLGDRAVLELCDPVMVGDVLVIEASPLGRLL